MLQCLSALLFLVSGVHAPVSAVQVASRPDSSGFVRDWLVAGPYPNPPGDPYPKGFTSDLLKRFGGEVQVVPYSGMTDEATFVADKGKLIAGQGATNVWGLTETQVVPVRWSPLHWTGESPVLSLDGRFGAFRDWLAAFAACWIDCPRELPVQVRVGSDDGYKLYLNHESLGGRSLARAAAPDQDVHPAVLHKGLNLLLLKITDRTGSHAFCVRLTDRHGKPVPGLKVLLDHPTRKFAARCENLDTVDVVEGPGFARIRLGTEPRFPGKLPLSVMVGLAQPKRCQVRVTVTEGDRRLCTRTVTADLSPLRAVPVETRVLVEQPGEIVVQATILDLAGRRPLARLSRRFPVLSIGDVRRHRDALRKRLAEQQARRRELTATVAKLAPKLASLRTAVRTQYDDIESLYARRREVLSKRYGRDGLSVEEPFRPATGPRETLCLNGDGWEMAAAIRRGQYRIDEKTPPKQGWTPAWLPMIAAEKYFRNQYFPAKGKGTPYGPTELLKCAPPGWKLADARLGDGLWYRTTVSLPDRWRGRRLLFVTEYAAHRVKVFWDGQLCGTHTGFPGRVNIELPRAVPGRHELLVLVQRARSFGLPTPRVTRCFGLFGDVYLTAVSDVRVQDAWVLTSYRNATLEARVWLVNHEARPRTVTVEGCVVLQGRVRKRLGGRQVTLDPGVTVETRFKVPWTDPELWGIGGRYGKPVLYHLVVTITGGRRVLDQHFTRFGFREFWKAGFHFYLNGKRLFLQGDNTGDRLDSRPQQVLWQHLLRSACNINTIRTHFEFQQGMIARVADELGMLVIPQWYPVLRVAGRSKKAPAEQLLSVEEFLTTPEHRQNLRDYAEWVKWLRNHPSVVLYSTDNEIFTQAWDTPDKLAANIRNDRLGAVYERFVKRLDPTRPVTRDGDEGTWGKLGTWQEDPPAEVANYHYPDFNTKKLVENWQSLYEKPVLFGETLYCSYGAWDGWIDAIPAQVAAKAKRCRRVLSLYRDLEVSGWVGMGPGLDGFTELRDDGAGNPWGITPALRDRYKQTGVLTNLPRYPYFPVAWPSRSGPGLKPEFHRFLSFYGYGSVNPYFADRKVCVLNAVNKAYKECTHPMPPLASDRPPEVLLTVEHQGAPLPFALVTLVPESGQACPPTTVRADSRGRAWFVLDEPGAYEVRVEGGGRAVPLTVKPVPFVLRAGFGYLPRRTVEVTP